MTFGALGRVEQSRVDAEEADQHGEIADRVDAEVGPHAERGDRGACNGRTDDARQVERRRAQGDGVDEVLARHEVCDERLAHGHLDGARRPGQQRQRVDMPDLDGTGQGQDEQGARLDHGHGVDGQQRASLVDAIGEDAAEWGDEHGRAEEEGHDQAQLQRRATQLEDEPGQRHRLHPRPDQAPDLAEPVAPVVRVAHRHEASSEPTAAGTGQRRRPIGAARGSQGRHGSAYPPRQLGDRHRTS